VSASIAVALVGAGQMASNHARVISSSGRAHLAWVVDPERERAARLAELYGGEALSSVEELVERRSTYGAAVVASATESHTAVALPLLDLDVPLLVEKPLAPTLGEVEALVLAATQADVPLQCGFVERFNPAVATALSLLPEQPWHVQTVRHSPVAPRIATNVVHDLLIHDLDLVARLFPSAGTPTVAAAGLRSTSGRVEIVDCVLGYDGGVASCSASRAGQRKVRTMSIATETILVEVDLLRQDVTRYHHLGLEVVDQSTFTYRAETAIDIPFVRHAGEPLALQLAHFLDLVEGTVDAKAEREGVLMAHLLADHVERAVGEVPAAQPG
jgi:predicted dehydrogenase